MQMRAPSALLTHQCQGAGAAWVAVVSSKALKTNKRSDGFFIEYCIVVQCLVNRNSGGLRKGRRIYRACRHLP
jgi:hypothetical protein